MRLSVISPTFNEAGNVPLLVRQLEQTLGDIDYEILIVDDDSPDLTWSIAQGISSKNPRVKILRRMKNRGLGVSVIDGFSAATGEILACIDADLQHDPSILPRMLQELQNGMDVVVGSRHAEGGSTGEWNRWRRLESWIATRTAQILLGFNLKDPLSGYFLIWREDFSEVKNELNGKGFKILLEILARLHVSKVKEVPYRFRPRTIGDSKLSGKVVLQFVRQVWQLSAERRHLPVRSTKSTLAGGIGPFTHFTTTPLWLALAKLRNWWG
jgi:dolichol-phosphate mannosyltransferase